MQVTKDIEMEGQKKNATIRCNAMMQNAGKPSFQRASLEVAGDYRRVLFFFVFNNRWGCSFYKFKGGIDDMKKLLRCTELVLRDFEFG